MKRKMIGAAAAYMSGSFFAFFIADPIAWIIAGAAVLMTLYFGRQRKWTKADDILLAVAFTAGIAVYFSYTILNYRPAVTYDGKTASFSGTVTEITRYDNDSAGYVLKGRINGRTKAKVYYYSIDHDAGYGDIININSCGFSVPEKDYLFDNETYYKSEGIFLSITSAEDVSVMHTDSRPVRNRMAVFRENMTQRLKDKSDDTTGGFLAAMLFGEKRQIDSDVKTALYRSGIGHILAVSGLHVSIIAMLFMSLLSSIHVNRFVSYALMNVMLIMFVIMANSPVSAVRAAIMMDFFYAAGLFRRQNNSLNSLSAASVVICLAQPYSIMNAGFLLSVSGTFGIAVFAPFMTKNMKYETVGQILLKDFTAALCTAVSVFPFCVLFFDETSVISPFSNVLLVPLCTAAMINGVLFVFTGGVLPILYPARVFVTVVVKITKSLSEIGIFHIVCGSANAEKLLIFLGISCVGLYFIGHSRKAVAAGTALSIAVFSVYSLAEVNRHSRQFIVALLGKGSSAAVVVSYMGSADIIDLSGNYRSPDYVCRYLKVNSIRSADHLAVTEKSDSQYESYMEVLDDTDIDEILLPVDSEIKKADHYYDKKGFGIERSAYSIRYAEGVLTVEYGNETVVIHPAKNGGELCGNVDIRYGKPAKGEEPTDGAVYLDSGNNIEFVLSENGSTERRL